MIIGWLLSTNVWNPFNVHAQRVSGISQFRGFEQLSIKVDLKRPATEKLQG